MASNLPPGVSEGMIPGNRPEDMAEEEFWNELDERLRTQYPIVAGEVDKLWDEYEDMFVVVAREARDMGYNLGYSEGQQELAMEQALREEDNATPS